jgi:tRNA (guanine-N7-)-methyltransferase
LKQLIGSQHEKIGKHRSIGGKNLDENKFAFATSFLPFLNIHVKLTFAIMAQKKLKRFAEIKTFSNVLEYPENIAGKWNVRFKNNYPITLELACGKGEYAVGLAQLYPQKNFIGVDIKGNRIWVGASYAINNNLNNLGFLRTQIQKIDTYFAPNEVEEIWITFPDPQLRNSKAHRRLTHPRYLRLYGNILKAGGKIHLKTDSPDLHNFTKTVIRLYNLKLNLDIDDVYKQEQLPLELSIKTYYETLDIAKSKKIFYTCFSLPEKIIDADDELDNFLKNKND